MGEKCEEAGVNIFPEFPGADLLYDDADRVLGVRTGDKGIDKEGKRKANFEPGVDLKAKVTVLGEGPRGSLTKQLVQRLGLDEGRATTGCIASVEKAFGICRMIAIQPAASRTRAFHQTRRRTAAAGFTGMQNNIVNIGYVTGTGLQRSFARSHAEFNATRPILSSQNYSMAER